MSPRPKRPTWIAATSDPDGNEVAGVAVVASYQTMPHTERPYKLRGDASTAKTRRKVEFALTRDEARKVVEDWVSMGLFGRHGRIETGAA